MKISICDTIDALDDAALELQVLDNQKTLIRKVEGSN